ncbi:S1 family peptidase [Caenimonas aquaedulcis]|uniref:Trypsin-like peptidase domain-containing protein n=1 Tax=Caenimonas aquaedulcis TaxID=2793270 RepID=A0A931H700_9BURK|nr:serine protease [Caenimonas aquaedulcis]MBG9389587.1 trypsin-like peptidase domain-containing protein [Caenimonas aquaedulcis]
MTEPLLLSTARISTFLGSRSLTGATGFFFEREGRLFLVTSRHVLIDKPSQHLPDRIQFTVHTSATNLSQVGVQSILLYEDGRSIWRQGTDSKGEIDVAVIELQQDALPAGMRIQPFTPKHLLTGFDGAEVGEPLLLVGFPLGFYDTLHHLPVVRQAVIASSFGVRFQGQGFFLTDARAHRGSSGAPVVMRDASAEGPLKYRLLGVHSSRLDMVTRDRVEDESLGLNCAWYADILLTLTEPRPEKPDPRQK